jgi:hypothetical protein
MRQHAPSHMDEKLPLDKVSSPLEDHSVKNPYHKYINLAYVNANVFGKSNIAVGISTL